MASPTQHRVRTAFLGLPDELATRLRSQLRDWMDVVLSRTDPREGVSQLVAIQPQAVLLYVDPISQVSQRYAHRVRHDVPDSNLIIVCEQESVGVTREAMRLGARAMVVIGTDDRDLERVFERMSYEAHDTSDDGMVVAVLGAKGGMGTTSLAINLAGVLAEDPSRRVALVDLALFMGEVGVYLNMQTPYALGELVRDVHRLDDVWIEENIPRHTSGFFVLSQPTEVDDIDAIKVADVVQSIAVLKRYFTHIVLDVGAQLSEVGLAGIHVADQTLVICTQELPALVSTRRRVGLLTQLGGDSTRTRIVINRWRDDAAYDRKSIEQYIQHGVNATVCNDYKSTSAGIEQGRLLVEHASRAPITEDIRALIPLFDTSVSPQQRSRKKLFGLF